MNISVKNLVFALLCFACLPEAANACNCPNAGHFLKVAQSAPLIVKVKILAHDIETLPLFMEAEVLDVYRGSYDSKTILVWGDNGFQCRAKIKKFPVGSTWVLALNGPGALPGAEGDYWLSDCGDFWVRVDGAYVVGNVSSTKMVYRERMVLARFKRLLGVPSRRKKADIETDN